MRWLCPTAAAACFNGSSRGRSVSPSASMPARMAPEDTRIVSIPCACTRARQAASAWRVGRCRPIPPCDSTPEPTLTTIRRGVPSHSCRLPGGGPLREVMRLSLERPAAARRGPRADAGMPSPVSAETASREVLCAAQRAARRASPAPWGRSILLAATIRGKDSRAGLYAMEFPLDRLDGRRRVSAPRPTHPPRAPGAGSARYDGENGSPGPAPWAAPSISPGMSATTKPPWGCTSTTPRFGVRVVNG